MHSEALREGGKRENVDSIAGRRTIHYHLRFWTFTCSHGRVAFFLLVDKEADDHHPPKSRRKAVLHLQDLSLKVNRLLSTRSESSQPWRERARAIGLMFGCPRIRDDSPTWKDAKSLQNTLSSPKPILKWGLLCGA